MADPNWRPLRGGSWLALSWNCCSAYRDHVPPDVAAMTVGVRVVCPDPNGHAIHLEDRRSRLLCGGSWLDIPRYCRSAFRGLNRPGYAYFNVGFRVVCPFPADHTIPLEETHG